MPITYLDTPQSNQQPSQLTNQGKITYLDNTPQSQSTKLAPIGAPQPQSPLNFADMLKMASLNDPQSQQEFLRSKFRFAEPTLDPMSGQPTGQFQVGNDPNNLVPIHPGGIGDTAMSVLASAASTIPSIGGQIAGAAAGAAAGSLVAPGVGTIAGGLIGAGLGAAGGEMVKNKLASKVPGFDPAKAHTDEIISGLFGVAGEGLGQVVNFGAKNFIAPKIAAALDGAIAKSDNPSGAVTMMTRILKFTSNMDEKEAVKGYQLGWGNIAKNHANWNPDEIDNIAKDVGTTITQKLGITRIALDKAEKGLLADNPGSTIGTARTLEGATDWLQKLGIVDKSQTSAEGMQSAFTFKKELPSNLPLKDLKLFMKKLGVVESEDGVFHIPQDSTIPLRDAIQAKELFSRTFTNPNFNPKIGAIAENALYGEGPTPLHPDGFFGIRNAINETASSTGHDAYIIANQNYSNLMKSTEALGVEAKNPDVQHIAKYLTKINKFDMFGRQNVSNLENELGIDIVNRSSQWAVAQAVGKCQPQMLRLGIVAGLLSLGIPGSAMGKFERVGGAFALASPMGVKAITGGSEMLGKTFSRSMGNKMLNSLATGAGSSVGRAALSQLVRKKVTSQ